MTDASPDMAHGNKPDAQPISYVVEVKNAPGWKWGKKMRVWVRGYRNGQRIYEETVGYGDGRYGATLRSQLGRAKAEAARRASRYARDYSALPPAREA